ncbi:MAG: hypothetical protein IPM02_25240 [Betaproteobacteria bacterium]|nr:hypothetical protein [Betaproteobacteria bacterium]
MTRPPRLIGADIQGEFDFAAYLGRFQYIPQPGTCFTRAAMLATGQWRDKVSYAADADFWMRMASRFPTMKLNQRVARYRYHTGQRDTQRAQIARDWAIAVSDLLRQNVLDRRQSRYARMGIYLAHYRYAKPECWWVRTRMLYGALFANPVAVLDQRFPKRELLPARDPLFRFLSRVKRKLGFRPRSALVNLLTKSRTLLGVLLLDLPRFILRLSGRKNEYLAICNRDERLEASPDGLGFRCDWKWASELHAPKHLPYLGLRLVKRALRDHPIRRLRAPDTAEGQVVSFVIGHRGMDRLPHLLATLESIAGQKAVSVECVVVEQDSVARIVEYLPAWVHYVHTPPPTPDMPYCRSWAFNIGVNHVNGSVLVLHDNDMLVPADYAANISTLMGLGYEVVNLKRFVIYLCERHTHAVFDGTVGVTDVAPFSIVQNLEGGGTVAITRQAYDEIGGIDESFIGWGGEDSEFWERAQTRNVWPCVAADSPPLASQSTGEAAGEPGWTKALSRARLQACRRTNCSIAPDTTRTDGWAQKAGCLMPFLRTTDFCWHFSLAMTVGAQCKERLSHARQWGFKIAAMSRLRK